VLRIKKVLLDHTSFSVVSALNMVLAISKACEVVNNDQVETFFFQNYIRPSSWNCSAARAGTIEL